MISQSIGLNGERKLFSFGGASVMRPGGKDYFIIKRYAIVAFKNTQEKTNFQSNVLRNYKYRNYYFSSKGMDFEKL